jgi:hypothetical protein
MVSVSDTRGFDRAVIERFRRAADDGFDAYNLLCVVAVVGQACMKLVGFRDSSLAHVIVVFV